MGKRGVAVVVIPGDVALHEAEAPLGSRCIAPGPPIVSPNTADLDALAALLTASRRVTVLCGGGRAGAHDAVVALAAKLKAPIVHALRGKEFVEYNNPYDVGMTGLIGFSSGYHAMTDCDTLLMVG